jgi:hypothetical protein
MATAIAEQAVNGPYVAEDASPQITALTWTAADTTGNTFVMSTGRMLLLARNSGASTRTIAVASSPDPFNREADIPATNIAAGVIFGRIFEPRGWEQTLGGKDLLVTANHAEVLFLAIPL